MIGFRQFNNIKDNVRFLLQHGYHIARKDMPQIKYNNRQQFLSHLDKNDILYKNTDIDPKQYKPTQDDVDIQKIISMSNNEESKNSPIVVSNDQYVADGHHRYFSSHLQNEPSMKAIVVDLPIVKLLDAMHNFLGKEKGDR